MSHADDFHVRTGSFLLRVRQDTPGELSGQIEHIQSGERSAFANITEVLAFIEQHIEPSTSEFA